MAASSKITGAYIALSDSRDGSVFVYVCKQHLARRGETWREHTVRFASNLRMQQIN